MQRASASSLLTALRRVSTTPASFSATRARNSKCIWTSTSTTSTSTTSTTTTTARSSPLSRSRSSSSTSSKSLVTLPSLSVRSFSSSCSRLLFFSTIMTSMGAAMGRKTEEVLSNKHVVLGTPLRPPFPEGIQTAVFATGCYWGAEKGFWRIPGVYSTAVGYAGGTTENPTYEESCSGDTGHTEAVFVAYDPTKISYSDLLRQFWECHDSSQYMGQGGDNGPMYRSAVYTYTDTQLQLAEASKAAYEKALGKTIHTEILPMTQAGPFYYAHEAYQQYLARPKSRKYCSAQPQGISLPAFESWAPEAIAKDENEKPKLPAEFWAKYAPKPGCVLKWPDEPIKWP